jgi:hypothetical protein
MVKKLPCACPDCVNGRHADGSHCSFCSGTGWFVQGYANYCPGAAKSSSGKSKPISAKMGSLSTPKNALSLLGNYISNHNNLAEQYCSEAAQISEVYDEVTSALVNVKDFVTTMDKLVHGVDTVPASVIGMTLLVVEKDLERWESAWQRMWGLVATHHETGRLIEDTAVDFLVGLEWAKRRPDADPSQDSV